METDVSQGLQSRTGAELQPSWVRLQRAEHSAWGWQWGRDARTLPATNTGSCLLTLGNLSLYKGAEKRHFREKPFPLPFLCHLPRAKPLAAGLGWLCFALCLVSSRCSHCKSFITGCCMPTLGLKKRLERKCWFYGLELFFPEKMPWGRRVLVPVYSPYSPSQQMCHLRGPSHGCLSGDVGGLIYFRESICI